MYRIGEIAKICNVSQKTLRFYEKKGLLKPAMVSNDTNYRYFDDESIKTVEQIKTLKSLGLSLKQIKEIGINNKDLDVYIDQRFKDLQQIIHTLNLLEKNKKGEFVMKKFVNDEDALGKWEYVGSVKSIGDKIDSKPYFLKQIYFLEKGQGYWLISAWSKDELYVYPGQYPIPEVYPYEIIDDKLYVSVIDDKTKQVDRIAIYSRVDRKKYKIQELEKKDDVDLKFETDKNIIGTWKGIAVINNPAKFDPNAKNFPSFIFDLEFENDGNLIVRYTNGRILHQNWTNNFCLDKLNSLAERYEIRQIDGKEFLFVENKNGDYIYNQHISSYFVFERN